MAEKGPMHQCLPGPMHQWCIGPTIDIIMLFHSKMPTFKQSKDLKGQFCEEKLKLAVKDVIENEMPLREAGRKHDISYWTLRRYVMKVRSGDNNANSVKKLTMTTAQIFTEDEELALKNYIITSSKMFHGLKKDDAKRLAYKFAKRKNKRIPKSWTTNAAAGEDWLKGFRNTHKDLSLRQPEATSFARTIAFDRHNVTSSFNNLKDILTRGERIPAQNIFNLDETGVTTVQTPRQVLAQTGTKQVGRITSAERRENVTMCACINAIGNALPPVFIFPRVRFKEFMLKGAPTGSLGLAGSSGWMNNTIFPQVLTHFIKFMNVIPQNPGLLLFDNHRSHLSLDVINIAQENGLSLLTFPPHCSHRMQPMDVCVFGPFKRFFNAFSDSLMTSNGGSGITIYEIAELAGLAYSKSFTIPNIISSFRATGIFPFNPDIFPKDMYLPASVTDKPPPSVNGMDAVPPSISGIVDVLAPPSVDIIQDDDAPGPALVNAIVGAGQVSRQHSYPTSSSSDENLLQVIMPFSKSAEKQKHNRRKQKSTILTDVPRKAPVAQSHTLSSSESDIKMPLQSDGDVSEAFTSESEENSGPKTNSTVPAIIEIEAFALVRVYASPNKFKNFIAKVISGPDSDNDYEVKFLKKSEKVKNCFVYPQQEDLASVAYKDFVCVLLPPLLVAQTKRLSGILKFCVDLSFYDI